MSEITNRNESSFSLQPALLRFTAIIVVLLIIIPLLPGLISNLAYSFSGSAPKIYWYLSRSAGFVGFTILWVSMVLGVGITNKMARLWPGTPAAFAMHEYVSLLGLAFALYHGLVLIGDHYVDFSLPRLLTPFSIGYKPFWVGLGQVGFYIWIITAASFYVRRFIGQKTWRLIHYLNFATYTMGLLHGMFSGTDSTIGWVRLYYLASGGILLALLAYRIYDSALKKREWLSKVAQQWTQTFTAVPSKLKRVQERLFSKRLRSDMALKRKTDRSALTSEPVQKIEENPIPAPVEEKAQPQIPVDLSSTVSVIADREASSSALVEKFEIGSGENKVNVRIFKEPPTRPIIVEPSRDAEVKQVDEDTLIVRLKKDERATTSQPSPSDHNAKRIIILDE